MPCTPLTIPPGLFLTNTVWKNQTETLKSGKSATYSSDGSLRVAGPNGARVFTPISGQIFRHMFFGVKEYLVVLATGATGLVDRRVHLIDYTTPTLTAHDIMFVSVLATALFPWLQYSAGAGDACFIGAPTTDVGVKGLSICRSDNGSQLLAGPSPYLPNSGTFANATATLLQIVDGTTVKAQAPLPIGRLEASPASQTFATVTLGGTGPASDVKPFTLANTGTDCLTVASIASNGPYAVTSQSIPFPASLSPQQRMTVTVTFAPTSRGTYDNMALPISRTPPSGSDKLTCSGHVTELDRIAPTWPTGSTLSVTNLRWDSALLRWPQATDNVAVSSYRVYRGDTPRTLLATLGATARQYTATGLAPATEFAFCIEAVDAAANESVNGPTSRILTPARPVVRGIEPSSGQPGQTVQIRLIGEHLAFAQQLVFAGPGPSLSVSNLVVTDSQVTAELTIPITAAVNSPFSLRLDTRVGPADTTSTSFTVERGHIDQVNDATWQGGATNIAPENRVGQVVVPSLPRLVAVEVALKTGNPGRGGDQVTLTILTTSSRIVATAVASIPEGFDGLWRFDLPSGGSTVTPSEPITLMLQDTGKIVFWWKYVAGDPYPAGAAYFAGSVFGTNDLLFRTYGAS